MLNTCERRDRKSLPISDHCFDQIEPVHVAADVELQIMLFCSILQPAAVGVGQCGHEKRHIGQSTDRDGRLDLEQFPTGCLAGAPQNCLAP